MQVPPDLQREIITLRDVGLVYESSNSTNVDALKGINLDIGEGEFVCLLGPSGCGKSTLLRIVAGFLFPTSGQASIEGVPITGANWQRGVVFQQPNLYPWLNVEKNVSFGLKMRGVPPGERQRITEHYLKKVGLFEFRKHRIYELSGGMRQRVSVARVLVNDPLVLLMDEPFGALDALTRVTMQNLVRDIWRETKKAILFITHDVDEALSLGSKVVVMSRRPGRIVQEFETGFSAAMTSENLQEVQNSRPYLMLREDILEIINNSHEDYSI